MRRDFWSLQRATRYIIGYKLSQLTTLMIGSKLAQLTTLMIDCKLSVKIAFKIYYMVVN